MDTESDVESNTNLFDILKTLVDMALTFNYLKELKEQFSKLKYTELKVGVL